MDRRAEKWLRILVLVVGTVFLIIGITRGEASTVMTKAINICMECIGIG